MFKGIATVLASLCISFSALAFEKGEVVQFPDIAACIEKEDALAATSMFKESGFNEEKFVAISSCGFLPPGIVGEFVEKLDVFSDGEQVVALWQIRAGDQTFYTWVFEDFQGV